MIKFYPANGRPYQAYGNERGQIARLLDRMDQHFADRGFRPQDTIERTAPAQPSDVVRAGHGNPSVLADYTGPSPSIINLIGVVTLRGLSSHQQHDTAFFAAAPGVSLSTINETSSRVDSRPSWLFNKSNSSRIRVEVIAGSIGLAQRQPALRNVGEERFGMHLGCY